MLIYVLMTYRSNYPHEQSNYPVNPLISPLDVEVVPDTEDRSRFGLNVVPGTVAARGIEDGLRAVREAYSNEGNELPLDARTAVMTIRQMYANLATAHEAAAAEKRRVPVDPVYINPSETAIIMSGLEQAVNRVTYPTATDGSLNEHASLQALDTHVVIAKQLAEQGIPQPGIEQ